MGRWLGLRRALIATVWASLALGSGGCGADVLAGDDGAALDGAGAGGDVAALDGGALGGDAFADDAQGGAPDQTGAEAEAGADDSLSVDELAGDAGQGEGDMLPGEEVAPLQDGGTADAADVAAVDVAAVDAGAPAASDFAITTAAALKKAIEGKAYSVQIEAAGGAKPYFFGLKAGALPKGLQLGADGAIAGTPTESGSFGFEIKALDDASPTATDQRAFTLEVGLAPLEIIGAQQINLLVTKLIVLPLIVVVDKLPVPYNAQLEAQGGKKPYSWAEAPLPGAVKGFLPNAGLPKGLTLGKDGKLSGAVSDASLVLQVKVPLTQIVLEGFFFAAEVSDSQATPQKKSALYIIPTVPIGGP